MKKYWLSIPFLLSIISVKAQNIVVNADGTHSVMINTGANTGVIVNSNGTHSTIINSGSNVSTVVNPNGTHSTVINNGSVSTIVNPDGTHSTAINNGIISQVVTQDQKGVTNNISDGNDWPKNEMRFEISDKDTVNQLSKSRKKKDKIRNEKEN